jgi:hypothetical protein
MAANSGIKLHREPLLHFLAGGVLLFLLFDLLPQQALESNRSIQVGPEQLLPFVIFRNPRLGPEAAAEYLASLEPGQYHRLVEDYIREEVMYREAVALGLDKDNYTARRRLITQLEYINQGFIRESLVITDAELQAYYDDNPDRYFVAPQITFTHVYIAGDQATNEQTRSLAESELLYLNQNSLPFHLAGSRGNHFLYHRNYVNKEQPEIASHFGPTFANKLFALSEDNTRWRGPFESKYGYHLVLVTSVKPGYYPQLDQVRPRVLDDVARVRVEEEIEKFYREVRSTYYIDVIEQAEP